MYIRLYNEVPYPSDLFIYIHRQVFIVYFALCSELHNDFAGAYTLSFWYLLSSSVLRCFISVLARSV